MGGEKRNRLQSIPNIYRIPFAHEQGAIVQETLNDFSQNGKHIDLKPEQEAAIRVYPSLQSIYQILVGVKEKISRAFASILMVCPV